MSRSTAEPLRASWQPRPPSAPGRRGARRPAKKRPLLVRLVRTYGWRIYALPVLVVLTALVVFDTVRYDDAGAQPGQNRNTPNQASRPTAGSPVATEQPPGPVNVRIPTAKLPDGGTYTRSGAGQWRVIPGSGRRVGTSSNVYTYTVEVEKGIDPSEYGGDEAFASMVDQTLADPRSWTGGGQISVRRVGPGSSDPDMRISLTTPNTTHRPDMCGYAIKYESSCWRSDARRVMINLARWVRGAIAFGGDLLTYRQYAINHEVGHAFDNGHVGCAKEGALAPVMMQQTFGVSNNFVARLNQAAGYSDPVTADGKVCKPNAWPNPQAN